MAYGTRYTVTLNPPLSSAGGAELANAFRFSFTTISEAQQEAEWKFQLANNGRSLNTLTDETATVGVYIDDSIPPESRKVSVAVYRFDTAGQYAAPDGGKCQSPRPQIRRHQDRHLEALTIRLLRGAARSRQSVIYRTFVCKTRSSSFPSRCLKGWYAADLSMQVSDGVTVTRRSFCSRATCQFSS